MRPSDTVAPVGGGRHAVRYAVATTLVATAVIGVAGCTGARPQPRPLPSAPTLPTDLPTRPVPARTAPADGRSQPVADPVYPDYGNPAIDVLRYDLDLAWEPSTRTLTGTATVTLRVVTAVDAVALDFSPAYRVDGASLDGRQVGARWRGGDLVLPADGPLAAGTSVTAVVSYHGTPAAGPFPGARGDVPSIGLHTGEDGVLWAMQEPYGAYTWFPCSDQPSDKAMFDVTITAPSGWTGVASGALTATSTAADGATTTHWHGGSPSATYLVAFAVDRFERFAETGPHGLPVTYWVRREDAERMLPVLRRTPQMLTWLEQRLGPYPFDTAGVVVVPDRSAMETQTLVSMGPLVGDHGEAVLLHELSHQWFGDTATPGTWRDLWLNEGFAAYTEMLYTVEHLGGSQETTVRAWLADDGRNRALSGPPGAYRPDRFAEHNVYYGPALMLQDIRERIGDPRFFAMLHDWPQHHRDGTVDRAEFKRWLAGYTDRSLSAVVDQWLDSADTPQTRR
jgi:aminopeptidase N